MARLLTQKDVYAIVNAMVEDLTGQQATTRVVDTSTFVSAGETILSYGTENVLNSLGLLMGRILIAARPYKGKFDLINAIDTGLYTHRLMKISYYSNKALPSGAFNTDLYTNLAPTFTNGQNKDANGDPQSTKSQWEQHYYEPMVMNFAGSSVWDECVTIPEVQLKQAFRSEGEFNDFFSGIMVRHQNDIELEKEAFRRAVVLNKIGGIYDLGNTVSPGSVVNLTAGFNAFYGTSYTSVQLRSTYLKEFLAYMVFTIKNDIKKLENESIKFHWTPASNSGNPLLRHTPRDKQKLFLYEPLMLQSEALVLPEIFNEKYLNIEKNYEGVEFWQNENNPSGVNVTPAIPDVDSTSATYGTQIKGAAANIPYVVGLLFDEDGLMTDFQMERADSTPLEARKLYRNLWMHFSKNLIDDYTEKAILYIMEDET